MNSLAKRIADRRTALTPLEKVWYSEYPKVLHSLLWIEQGVRKAKAEAEAGFLAHKTGHGDIKAERKATESLENALMALKGVPSLDDLKSHIANLHQAALRV